MSHTGKMPASKASKLRWHLKPCILRRTAWRDSESAVPVSSLPHRSSVCTLVTEAVAHGQESHAMDDGSPSKQATVEVQLVRPAAQSTEHEPKNNSSCENAAP